MTINSNIYHNSVENRKSNSINSKENNNFNSFLTDSKNNHDKTDIKNKEFLDEVISFNSLSISDADKIYKKITSDSYIPKVSKSVDYLNKIKAFDRFSQKDVKIFKEILSDDYLSKKEIKKLSFEEVKNLNELMWERKGFNINFCTKCDEGVKFMISVVNYTNNDRFNKALFDTIDKSHIKIDMMLFFRELAINLGQALAGNNLESSYVLGSGNNAVSLGNRKKINISFQEFLNAQIPNLINMLSRNKSNLDSKNFDLYKDIYDVYEILRESYNKLGEKD